MGKRKKSRVFRDEEEEEVEEEGWKENLNQSSSNENSLYEVTLLYFWILKFLRVIYFFFSFSG
uniref:Uncharacterized protein n=1 Tax=Rhizophora mucronata TaxID=61149 RepID=A0A2P2KKT0_RHIMU